MSSETHSPKAAALQAWTRALAATAAIREQRTQTLPLVIDQLGERFGDAPALLSPAESLSYQALAQDSRRCARWALEQGLTATDVVCLLMSNCPAYLAIWLGLSRVGVTVALLNTQLRAEQLAHAINLVRPRHLICGANLLAAVDCAQPLLSQPLACWAHGASASALPRLDVAIRSLSGAALGMNDYPAPTLEQRALCIYTSGTTGLPKAANISHFRLMQWSHWFAGMMATGPHDRIYDCLPMYHSIGGVVAPGAALLGGGAVVLRERFSLSHFWSDVVRERCTLFQYIGELCRYLLSAPEQPEERRHQLRLCCGNGLRAEVWQPFQQRFRIPQILEYYAATEGSFSLYNCEGRVGSIGRMPAFLSHRMPIALIRLDADSGEPLRDASGRCVRCAPNEPGEAVGRLIDSDGELSGQFEGYANGQATPQKLLRDVLSPGDCWYRSGDLMRQDAQGFFYFVDRLGDTFRWKGENVSTTEVAAALASCRGVRDAVVYGVPVPGTEGRGCMAALVVGTQFELAEFRSQLAARLPGYARPLVVRILPELELTATFKLKKQQLLAEGYDPQRVREPLYWDDSSQQAYVPLDAALYQQIQSGALRL